MPPCIQDAAAALGYDQKLWDTSGVTWSSDLYWDELTPEARGAAALLGYDEYSWDDINSGAGNDYVFQVGSSDAWVSKYQILYFFAALSFLVVGVVDLVCERRVFHVLMILAGAFGVVSAVYVEEDVRLSNILNSVSVHFYLLEGITLFGEHKRVGITAESGKWMKRSIMFGDFEFILGALLDVIVRSLS